MLYIILRVLLRVDSIIYLSSWHIYRMYTYVDETQSNKIHLRNKNKNQYKTAIKSQQALFFGVLLIYKITMHGVWNTL